MAARNCLHNRCFLFIKNARKKNVIVINNNFLQNGKREETLDKIK